MACDQIERVTREADFAAIISAHRGGELLDRTGEPGTRAALVDLLEALQFGSLCAVGGFTPYPVRSAIKHWPEDFA